MFLPTTLASLPHGVMLLNRSTTPRDSATDIEKISRKGTPEREQSNRSVVKIYVFSCFWAKLQNKTAVSDLKFGFWYSHNFQCVNGKASGHPWTKIIHWWSICFSKSTSSYAKAGPHERSIPCESGQLLRPKDLLKIQFTKLPQKELVRHSFTVQSFTGFLFTIQ